LVLRFVEDLLQTLQEGFDLLSSSVQPLLEHADSFLLLLIALIQLQQAAFQEKLLSYQPAHDIADLLLADVSPFLEQRPGLLRLYKLLQNVAYF
jgi:hypothetical protein